ncbi:cytokinin response factor 4 [Actinidia rufa]|uniref:Cytokinin response factor 4 n=1 Tax=Actinidia rufa TaxID=165716 RepID=A0A7J0EAB2_9ERIC|nr:cytokinin response factor 4 [Actinidia rufa]
MDESMSVLRPIKYTEHRNVTKKLTKPSIPRSKKISDDHRQSPELCSGGPRVVRISVTDPDATDSSSGEEDALFGRRRVKRYVNEIRCETACKSSLNANKVWKRKVGGGNSLLAKRKPTKLVSGERRSEAAMVYDNAAIKLRGPHALTNFITPPLCESPENNVTSVSGDESGDESHSHSLSSPTSVLRFRTHSSEEAQPPKLSKPVQQGNESNDSSPVQEDPCFLPDFMPMEMPFLDDIFTFEPPGPIHFDDPPDFADHLLSDDLSGMVTDPIHDFGLWQVDGFLEDLGGEFFTADPLVVL